MASPQVFPNSEASSRKQGHLEAGKRRLEEFRKKRAEVRGKKVVSTGPLQSTETSQVEKQPQESDHIRLSESNGVATSERGSAANSEASGVLTIGDSREIHSLQTSVLASSNGTHAGPPLLANNYDALYTDAVQGTAMVQESKHGVGMRLPRPVYGSYDFQREDENINQSSFNSTRQYQSKENEKSSRENSVKDSVISHGFVRSAPFEKAASVPVQNEVFLSNIFANDNTSPSYEESDKTVPFMSRSSKVDNIDIQASLGSQHPFVELDTVRPFPKLVTSDVQSKYEPSMSSSLTVKSDVELLKDSVKENSMEKAHEFPLLKQDEDFSSLEQHIEDLTQEKFSLQRAVHASRALAESLALENSSLTDSFNQQGSVLNELKHDMEGLQDEIKAQLLELESIKMEYANAQLECNAADERAKILASEVIGLEEKALRLRSSELKLERQLENTNAETASYKKKISTLEKDCQDLQSTVNALQKEKKLLQTALRKASTIGKSATGGRTPSITKDVSTSTEDLGGKVFDTVSGEDNGVDSVPNTVDHEMQHPVFSSSNMSSVSENRQFQLPVESVSIPPDQLQTIGNINSLITEISLEKEELIRALATESSQSSRLKDLNKDLSRKLEAQTQRLELLTAQNMANENIPARQINSHTMPGSAAYTDEGDEVVERVLGWIMKLFPAGPGKRRTSKLL